MNLRCTSVGWCAVVAVLVLAETAHSTSHYGNIQNQNIVVMAGTPVSSDPALASRLEQRGVLFVGEVKLPLNIFSARNVAPIDLTLGGGYQSASLTEQQRYDRDNGRTLVIGIDKAFPGSRFRAYLKDDRLTRLEIRRRDTVISLTAPEERGGALVFRVLVIDPTQFRDELPPRETDRSTDGHNRDSAGPAGDEGAQDTNTLNAETASALDPATAPDTVAVDPPTVVNVMVVYTKAAADEAFDIEGLDIELLIDVTVLVTSIDMEQQTNISLNLVHVQQVSYEEVGNIAEDLRRLECPCDIHEKNIGDNHLNEVFVPWRENKADIVSLWTYSPGEAGMANIMSQVGTSFSPRAVSVVDWWHAIYNYSFAHEISHNFGARHDRAWDNTSDAPYAFNHGFVNVAQKQVTVMGYTKTCMSLGFFCTRHWYWSDPTIAPINTWGLPSFMPLSADNAKALRASAPTISNLQSRKDLVGCCKRRGTVFDRIYEPGSCNW